MSPIGEATLSGQINGLNMSDDTASETSPADIVGVVDDLLNQLNSKFQGLSSEMLAKMDEMSRRLDTLEANLQASGTGTETEAEGEK